MKSTCCPPRGAVPSLYPHARWESDLRQDAPHVGLAGNPWSEPYAPRRDVSLVSGGSGILPLLAATWLSASVPVSSLLLAVAALPFASRLTELEATDRRASAGTSADIADGAEFRSQVSPLMRPQIVEPGDPRRIRRTLPAGKTWVIHVKGGMTTRAAGFDWADREETVDVAYAFEMIVHWTIESNDGRRIGEVRRFDRVWEVVLVSGPREGPGIEFGRADEPLLDPLQDLPSHVGTRRVLARLVAQAVAPQCVRNRVDETRSQGFWNVHTLSGKVVRITYAEGGEVESLAPLGCQLARSDAELLRSTGALFDRPVPLRDPDRRRAVQAVAVGGRLGGPFPDFGVCRSRGRQGRASQGMEWSKEQLRRRWLGEGFRLVRRG